MIAKRDLSTCAFCGNEHGAERVINSESEVYTGPTREQREIHRALCACWTCRRLHCPEGSRFGKCPGIFAGPCPGREQDDKRLRLQRLRADRARDWRIGGEDGDN